jgi:hypothetical protein
MPILNQEDLQQELRRVLFISRESLQKALESYFAGVEDRFMVNATASIISERIQQALDGKVDVLNVVLEVIDFSKDFTAEKPEEAAEHKQVFLNMFKQIKIALYHYGKSNQDVAEVLGWEDWAGRVKFTTRDRDFPTQHYCFLGLAKALSAKSGRLHLAYVEDVAAFRVNNLLSPIFSENELAEEIARVLIARKTKILQAVDVFFGEVTDERERGLKHNVIAQLATKARNDYINERDGCRSDIFNATAEFFQLTNDFFRKKPFEAAGFMGVFLGIFVDIKKILSRYRAGNADLASVYTKEDVKGFGLYILPEKYIFLGLVKCFNSLERMHPTIKKALENREQGIRLFG